MSDSRTTEVFVEAIGWSPMPFSAVKEGDRFRMFESTGEVVMDDAGRTEFVATKDSYQDNGVWVIVTKDED